MKQLLIHSLTAALLGAMLERRAAKLDVDVHSYKILSSRPKVKETGKPKDRLFFRNL
jgi:hypothetical protein